MAAFGAKYIKFAPFQTEPEDVLPTYEEAVELGALVKADLTVNLASGEIWANNALNEKLEEFGSGTLAVEVSDMTDEIESKVFGSAFDAENKELVDNTGDTIPYGGLGYLKTLIRNGKKVHQACFYPKVKAAAGNDTANTKSSSITLASKPLSFTIHEPNTGDWRYRKTFDKEADAKAYLDGKFLAEAGEPAGN